MADIMKEKAGTKANDHEEHGAREAPATASRWSKWKSLAGALALATGVATGQAGCGSENTDSNISIPSDGGCTNDGDATCDGGAAGMDAGTGGHDSGTGGSDGGTGGMDGGSGGMDGGVTDGGSGGMDGGSGGMDGGVTDGGSGGMDGGVSDGGSDAGPTCAVASTGSYSGFISTVTSAKVGNYTIAFDSYTGSDVLVDVSLGACSIESGYHCPTGTTTNIDDTANGKQIQVHVFSSTASYATVSITVVNH